MLASRRKPERIPMQRLSLLALIVYSGATFAQEHEPLPHFAWRSDLVATGGVPAGDAAFKKLKELGIETVVNVDGSQPDLSSAKRYGLRYIHLPVGYDVLSQHDLAAMRRLANEVPGKIYIHCHHGIHRGPAYAAVLLRMEGKLTPDAARQLLQDAGTGKDYPGLWYSATEQPLDNITPCAEPLREGSVVNSLAAVMVKADEVYDVMKQYIDGGMKPLADHPDFDMHSAAKTLGAVLSGASAFPEYRDPKFAALLDKSIADALNIQQTVKKKSDDALPRYFAELKASCVACHKKYRNPPLQK